MATVLIALTILLASLTAPLAVAMGLGRGIVHAELARRRLVR